MTLVSFVTGLGAGFSLVGGLWCFCWCWLLLVVYFGCVIDLLVVFIYVVCCLFDDDVTLLFVFINSSYLTHSLFVNYY